ncbi:MAG: hypothetical protein KKE86_11225 [Planctomycetes bacterium]|nr:hypothetical protein [Planctomycetota bacterium]MBU4399892.1 hypothetical protein [Planctomycetota bacterium]MCG2683039.1 hypothetical protein [Planctomycetales bacterium]
MSFRVSAADPFWGLWGERFARCGVVAAAAMTKRACGDSPPDAHVWQHDS